MQTQYDELERDTIRVALGELKARLAATHTALAAGLTIDLTGLDTVIGNLCGRALSLPPPLARQTLPDLTALRDAAEALVDTLSAWGGR